MLAVTLNELRFEYDIHSLVKAFYPAEMVKVFKEGTKDLASDGDNPEISVDFEADRIRIRVDGQEEETLLSRPEEKNVVKNELKQLLYRMLSAKTGKLLPWGEPDRHPPGQDRHAASGGRKEQGGDPFLYGRNLFLQPGEGGAGSGHRLQGAGDPEGHPLREGLQPVCGEFPSAPPPACTAPLPLSLSPRGGRGWRSI